MHGEDRLWVVGSHLRPELVTVPRPGRASSPVVLIGCAPDGASPSGITNSLPVGIYMRPCCGMTKKRRC